MNDKRTLLDIGSIFDNLQVQQNLSGKKSSIEIYKVKNLKQNSTETLKIDRVGCKKLKTEFEILQQVQDSPGFPIVRQSSFEKNFDFIVHNGFYNDLNTILEEYKQFDLPTTVSVYIQLMNCIETIHKKMIVHGNISPKCVLVNLLKTQIILSGFTESLDFKNALSSSRRTKNELSCSFASLNSHCDALGYKDDLESIGYLLIYMLTAKLPWKKFFPKNTFSKWQKVYIMKRSQNIEILCANCPKQYLQYFTYIRNLKEKELPDYEYLRILLIQLIEPKNLNTFMWDPKKRTQVKSRSVKKPMIRTKTEKISEETDVKEKARKSNSYLSKLELSIGTLNQSVDKEKTLQNDDIPLFKNRIEIMKSRQQFFLNTLNSKSNRSSSGTLGCHII